MSQQLIRTDWDIVQLGVWDPAALHYNVSLDEAIKLHDQNLRALGIEHFKQYTVHDEIVRLQLPIEGDPYRTTDPVDVYRTVVS